MLSFFYKFKKFIKNQANKLDHKKIQRYKLYTVYKNKITIKNFVHLY
jgi:hypothetical protein